ncbi:MAG: hypothetical protein ACO2PN_13345 [Pyrobaculum sp.]|jgi:hypothetical protein
MSDEVKALLAAAEDVERRCLRYSKVATLLDSLSLSLYATAGTTFGISLAEYLLHGGGFMLFVAGLALWWSAYIAKVLRDFYDRKATKTARQACVFRSVAEIITEIREVKTKLEEAVDRIEQELERRSLERIHAN